MGLCDLPEEVLTLIGFHLDSRGICSLTQTCTALRDVERQLGFRAMCWPAICAREWDVSAMHPSLVPCLDRGLQVMEYFEAGAGCVFIPYDYFPINTRTVWARSAIQTNHRMKHTI